MSEQNPNEMTFQIQRVYTKDISFEAPNAPQIFQKEWEPDVTATGTFYKDGFMDGIMYGPWETDSVDGIPEGWTNRSFE